MAKKDDKQPRIHVTSYNQQGGITAGIINIQGPIPAQIKLSDKEEREQTPVGYLFRREVTLVTPYVMPILTIVAYAPTLQSLEVIAADGRIQMSGTYGGMLTDGPAKGQPYIRWQEQNASGKYIIEAVTEREEDVNLVVA